MTSWVLCIYISELRYNQLPPIKSPDNSSNDNRVPTAKYNYTPHFNDSHGRNYNLPQNSDDIPLVFSTRPPAKHWTLYFKKKKQR